MTTPDLTPHDATWLEELIAYRDGELPLLRRWAVRWHLASCAACREELLIMTQISEQLRTAEQGTFGPDDSLDPALRDKILASVTANEPLAHEPAPTPPAATLPWWRAGHGRELMALGACAVVFAVAASTMLQPHLKQGFSTAASAINTSTDGPDTDSAATTSAAAPNAMSDATASGGSTASGTFRNGSLPPAAAPAPGAARTYPLTESDTTPSSQRSGIGGPVRI